MTKIELIKSLEKMINAQHAIISTLNTMEKSKPEYEKEEKVRIQAAIYEGSMEGLIYVKELISGMKTFLEKTKDTD